jgi:glucan phosphorylase
MRSGCYPGDDDASGGSLIGSGEAVHMANLACVGSHAVNGVPGCTASC